MKKINLYLRRLTLLLIVLLGASSSGWSEAIESPAVLDESSADVTAVMDNRGGGMSFNLKPLLIGDVNSSGVMDINDVTALINAMLTGDYTNIHNGDVDDDGTISINDVTELIRRLLNGIQETRLSTIELAKAMNTMYRNMRWAGWTTTGNTHQCFGIMAYTLAAEVMGDDMIMAAQGSGWFWFDAAYNVKTRYTTTSWRCYDLWTAYYTCIAEANSIIAQKDEITGDADLVDYYVGQAYALRAYSYFMLAQWFARTYKGHESEPCVPIYDGQVFNYPTGQPRATVSQVYTRIDTDISKALQLTEGKAQLSPDHMSHAVVKGLKARVCLVKEEWAKAYLAAKEAINEVTEEGKGILEVSEFAGVNDATAANVMWGAQIPDNDVGMYASFFAHMDLSKSYAQRSPKQITQWLYNKMNTTDARRVWWDPSSNYSTGGYVTQKFTLREGSEWGGDYIYMRVEEMYLTAAEAGLRAGLTAKAKEYLNALMAKRDANYTGSNKSGTSLGDLTTDETGSLLEEILIQRRLELWGEDGRIMTIRRLHQGFERPAEEGWPASLQLSGKALYNPESYAWVLTIPQSEFTGNANLNPEFIPEGDQNPLGDVTGVGQNLSFETASSSMTTSRTDFYYNVTVTRESTEGEYINTVTLTTTDGDALSTSRFNLTFADGQSTTEVRIACNPLTLGRTYHGTLTLSPYDVDCYTGGTQISTHAFTIYCQNGNPAGQKISFAQPTYYASTGNEYKTVSVTLTRENTDEEYSARVLISGDPEASIYTQYVYFAPGQSSAILNVNFNDMELEHTYSCVLTLSPEDVATGGAITSTQVTVKRENWVYIGSGTYESEFWDQTFGVNIQQHEGTNTYRLMEFFTYNYNVEFTIDGNRVYIDPQPCYDSGTYGTVYMKGYANEDNSGYAGTYDPNTKTATMQIRYFVDIGAWPTANETLIMP